MGAYDKLKMLAGMTALAMNNGPFSLNDTQRIFAPPEKKHKCNAKKCKSCKFFKASYRCEEPMRMACERYEPKKKKK